MPPEDDSTIDLFRDSTEGSSLLQLIKSEEFLGPIKSKIEISSGELLLIVLRACLKHCLPLSGIANFCKAINCIFSDPVLPSSLYSIDKLFNPETTVTYHSFCPNCSQYLDVVVQWGGERRTCDSCTHNFKLSKSFPNCIFALINPSEAIAEYVELFQEHYDSIMQRTYRENSHITDIYDGQAYKKFVNSLPYNDKKCYVNVTFNTDGAQAFKSSKKSLWPIYLMINEIPLDKRSQFIIPCSIWFGESHPDMQMYLEHFVNLMMTLRKNGITCTIKGEKRVLRLYVVNCAVDTPARCQMNGTMQFNAHHGCDWCLHPGTYYARSMRYPASRIFEYRDTEATKRLMEEASDRGLPIQGVRRISPLIHLEGFDVVHGFTPDFMHCILIGVVRQITNYIIAGMRPPQRKLLDDALMKFRVPAKLSRLPRSTKMRADWKAKEWENWVLYYSVPLFELICISDEILEHWIILVDALHIVLGKKIHPDDLKKAHKLLKKFMHRTEKLYTTQAMTYNLHQLGHIVKSVREFGPLQCHSAFPFESANYSMVQAIKSANGVIDQIIRYINLQKSVNILRKHVYPAAQEHVREYMNSMQRTSISNCVKVSDKIYLCSLMKHNNIANHVTTLYSKMIKDGCVYQSYEIENRRTCNAYARLQDQTFIRIIYFVHNLERKEYYVEYNIIDTLPHNVPDSIYICSRVKEESCWCHVEKLDTVCVFLQLENVEFIIPSPNILHY